MIGKKSLKKKENKNKNDKTDKKERKRMMDGLKHEALQEIRPLAIGSVALVVSTLSNQALPRLVGKIVDEKSNAASAIKNNNNSNVSSSMLLSVVLFGGVASMVRTTMFNRAEDGIASRLRTRAFQSLLYCRDLEWFQVEHVHDNTNEKLNDDDDDDDAKPKEKETETEQKDNSKATPAAEGDRVLENDSDEKIKDVITKTSNDDDNIGMSPVVIGEILNRDVAELAHTIPGTFANLLRSTSSCLYATYHMWKLNPSLLVLSVGTVPLVGTGAIFLRKYVTQCSKKRREIEIRSSSFIEERMTHISLVKMSNREKDELNTYQTMQQTYRELGRNVALAKGYFMGFVFSASSMALLALVNVGGKAVEQNKMTSGQLTSFTTYSFLLALGASGINQALNNISQSMLCAKRVYKIIDHVDSSENKNATADDNKHEDLDIDTIDSISLENVSFQYKSNPSKTVLKNISIELKRGTVVALVGKNGSGKTTISSILGALYKPTSGKTTISSKSNATIDYNSLPRDIQKHIVQVVEQSSPMFNMSIKDNVTYTNPNASNEEIERVLQATNCHRLLESKQQQLPLSTNNTEKDSYQYQVGLNGCKLSVGERQRLAVARALLSDPMLLVLDEPTSALDEEGESAISDAILSCRSGDDGNGSGRALLLITHNPKSLQLADMIVVLKDGQVAETGTYQQLTENINSALCSLMPDLVLTEQ